jgi:hypothetical protein
MPKYRVTVRFSDLDGRDPASVQQALEEKLKTAGLERWRVLSINTEGAPSQRALSTRAVVEAARRPSGGGLLLVAAAAWAIWFFSYLME